MDNLPSLSLSILTFSIAAFLLVWLSCMEFLDLFHLIPATHENS